MYEQRRKELKKLVTSLESLEKDFEDSDCTPEIGVKLYEEKGLTEWATWNDECERKKAVIKKQLTDIKRVREELEKKGIAILHFKPRVNLQRNPLPWE